MRSYKTEAIVIKRHNFLEKDRILTLFSKEKGKISTIAKGARRPGSRFSYHSDLGTIAIFHLHRGKNIDLITEVTPIFSPIEAHGRLDRSEKIGYAFKLLDKLYHEHEPHLPTFEVLAQTIRAVSSNDYQLTFLIFLAKVIEDLGLKPEFINCLECGRQLKENDKINFDHRGGLIHCDCAGGGIKNVSNSEIKLLRLIFSNSFEKIGKAKVEVKIFEKVFTIVRNYLEWHFGKILPEKILWIMNGELWIIDW